MVSMSSPQSVEQAEGYLEKENYYQKNSILGTFQGKGLEHLGIEKGTTVDPKIYKTLLQGFHPTTGEKLVKNAGKEEHRAGFDVTFSAPKSVSVLMEYYEANGQNVKAEMIRKAHDLAVENTMKKLDIGSGKTRIRIKNGKQIRVDADLIYATFQHDTSREIEGNIDPQLHSHNFIFTPSFYTDEKTGEVRSLALTNELIFRNKMYFGQNYRSELASSLAEMGYKIEVSSRKNGFFEIEGFDEKQLKTFSQRSELIQEKLPEYREKYPKMQEAQLLQLIVKDTKNAKKEIDREAVREANLERMGTVGIDKSLIDSMENRGQKAEINEELMSIHLEKSLENIMDRQSIFSQEDLSKMVLKYGLEYGYNESDYMPIIAQNSQIVELHDNVFSTVEMIAAEKNVIFSVHKGRDKYTEFALYGSQKLQTFLEEKYPTLTDEQVKMTQFILGNKDQFVAIQGDAGTGKTFAAKVVKNYLETYHDTQEVIGLSFTGKASQNLEDDTKIKSRTVHSFLAKEEKEKDIEPKNRLIIVDEAGMMGSLQMNDLIENAKKNNDRIVFMGDTKQFKSISAGNIFNDMQELGTKTVKLSQAIRFESELTKEATTSLKMELVKHSLETIKNEGTLQELSRENQIKTIAKNYSSLKPKERKNTLIISSLNEDKEAINWAIRSNLNLGGNSYKVKSHASLNGIERHYSEGYEKGFQVAIQGDLEGFKNGQKLYVTGSVDNKTITVKGSGKNAIEKQINVYEHGDKLQIFKEVEKPFAKGEVIVFTKNTVLDKSTRISVKNGERTKIKSINKHGDVTTTEGKKFNIHKMPYLDHGYAITDVKSQGSTYKNIIIMAKSEMANFHSFYTQITRAKRGISLFTDNQERLEENVLKESDFKTTLDYTIKKKEKTSSIEKTSQQVQRKEKPTFKNISTKAYEANPLDLKKSTQSTLRKVGVYQSNLDSLMKIDIYRKSIGKLDGVGHKTTTPHKKYRGIEVAKKQQKEQTYGNTRRDTSTFKEDLQKTSESRTGVQEPQSSRDTRDKERASTKQSRNDRSLKKDDRSTGLPRKAGRNELALKYINEVLDYINNSTIVSERKKIAVVFTILSEHYNDKKINMNKVIESINKASLSKDSKIFTRKIFEKWSNQTKHHKKGIINETNKTKAELRRKLARVGLLQSNTYISGDTTLFTNNTSLCRLSKQHVVSNESKPRVFLFKTVQEGMGGGCGTNKSLRWERDINSNVKKQRGPGIKSDVVFEMGN